MKRTLVSSIKVAVAIAAVGTLAACGGGGGNGNSSNGNNGNGGNNGVQSFSIGGSVAGLSGSGLTLSSNGQTLAVSSNGAFTFPTALASGTAYNVTIATQPESPAQDCSLTNGSGTLGSNNITNVAVVCGALAPLTVATSTPAAGASGVARDNALTLNFSTSLNAATVSTSTVTLSHAIAGQIDIAVSASGSQINVTPRRQLLPATPYTLTVSNAVRGSRGQEMAASTTLNFTTRDGTWQTSTYIENAPTRVRNPQVASNSSSIVVVWQDDDAGIGMNRYVPGTGWSGPQQFQSGAGSNNPQVAVDSQDASHVVWNQYQYPQTSLRATHYTVASGFSAAELAEGDDVHLASAQQLAVDGQDNVFAIWRYGSGTSSSDGTIWSNRYVPGSGWTDIQRLDSTVRSKRDPRIAVDAAGNAVATWTQPDLAGRSQVWSNRYVAGSGWGFSARVDNTAASADAYDGRIAMDAAGNAMAIYTFTVNPSDEAIGASRYTVGTGWSTPVAIDVSTTNIEEAQIAVDPAGNALAVWIEDSALNEIWANRYTVGSGWGTAQRLAIGGSTTEGVQIAIDKAGNAIAVWMQYQSNVDDSTEIMATRYVAGAGWGTAQSIDNETDDVIDPHVAFDASGNAVVAWISYDGAVNNVRANRFE